jgi:divalent metal cation (Fe/Co/Zn/Cd) transporter
MIGFVGNEMVAGYRIRVGRRIGSAALIADGLHARADGLTSLAVLLGAAGVAVGGRGPIRCWSCDHYRNSRRAPLSGQPNRPTADGRCRPSIGDQSRAAIGTVDGIQSVRDLKIRWIRHTLRAEADVASAQT